MKTFAIAKRAPPIAMGLPGITGNQVFMVENRPGTGMVVAISEFDSAGDWVDFNAAVGPSEEMAAITEVAMGADGPFTGVVETAHMTEIPPT